MIVLKIAVVIGCIISTFLSMNNILEAKKDKEILFNTLVMFLSVFALIYISNN